MRALKRFGEREGDILLLFNTPTHVSHSNKGLYFTKLQDIVQQCLVYIDTGITMENSTEGFGAKTVSFIV